MNSATEDRKVLSIGYGAFTIRLEGFEDPFTHLQRITEYFRIIAHNDQSFGSKPLSAHPEAMQVFSQAMSETGAQVELGELDVSVKPAAPRQVEDFIPEAAPEPAARLPLTEEFRSPLIVRKERPVQQTYAANSVRPAAPTNDRVLLRPGKTVQNFSMVTGSIKTPTSATQARAIAEQDQSLAEFRRAFRRFQLTARNAKPADHDNPFSRLKDEVRETVMEDQTAKRAGTMVG